MGKTYKDVGPFTVISNIVIQLIPEIGRNAFVVYSCLACRANSKGECWPGYDKLQEDTGLSRAPLAEAIKILVDTGLVQRKKHFSKASTYRVISSENELMMLPLVQKMNYISSENELPLVQNLNSNKNHLTRIIEQETWGRIPVTAKEAYEHPILMYLNNLLDGFIPGDRDYKRAIDAVVLIHEKFNSKTDEIIKSSYTTWTGRKTKQGNQYDPLNLTWLTDWAVNGGPVERSEQREGVTKIDLAKGIAG